MQIIAKYRYSRFFFFIWRRHIPLPLKRIFSPSCFQMLPMLDPFYLHFSSLAFILLCQLQFSLYLDSPHSFLQQLILFCSSFHIFFLPMSLANSLPPSPPGEWVHTFLCNFTRLKLAKIDADKNVWIRMRFFYLTMISLFLNGSRQHLVSVSGGHRKCTVLVTNQCAVWRGFLNSVW